MKMSFVSLGRHIEIISAYALAISSPFLAAGNAYAAGSNMPWEQPLNQILQSVEGPVAKILAVIVIVVTGLSIAFAASSFFLSFFSFGGGASI